MAADAAFSDDGKTVYAINGLDLDVIDTTTGVIRQINPEGVLEIEGICRAGEGAFYLISKNALWRWKPLSEPAVLVKQFVGDTTFSEVACSDDGKQILVVGQSTEAGRTSLLYQSESTDVFAPVWLRHLPDARILGPEFMPDGTLMFSAEGDLWHGELEWDPIENDNGTPPTPRVSLTAYRYAPVAKRLTYSGTSNQEGVSAIAFGAGRLFAHISRMNGSGWGNIVSLDAPAPMKDGSFTIHNGTEDAIKALRSLKEITDNPSRSFLCASPDRKHAYMTSGSGETRTHFLADADYEKGEPIAFRIGDKILGRE